VNDFPKNTFDIKHNRTPYAQSENMFESTRGSLFKIHKGLFFVLSKVVDPLFIA